MIKFFSSNSPEPKWFSNKHYKFPFVDVFFYNKNETHMWFIHDNYDKPEGETWNGLNYLSLKNVFPLHLRPLGELLFSFYLLIIF